VSYNSPYADYVLESSSTRFFQETEYSPARLSGESWPITASRNKDQNTTDFVCTHTSLDQHILLCVTFFGWAATRSQFKLEKYWDGVQKIYEHYEWDKINKMQVFSMMDYDLAVIKSLRKAGSESLPGWANPTYVVSYVLRLSFFASPR